MAQIKARENYVILLDLLAKANDSVKEPSISDVTERERLLDAHRLANKFIGHALTVLHLSRGYKVKELPSFQPVNFTDSWSIDVLTRTAMEAFLTFHYVFYAPATKVEKDCRYWAYKAAGIAERKNAPASTEEYRQKQVEEQKELDKLHKWLKSNTVFQSLTDKQKNRILGGEWRLKSWREIAIDARFSNMLASHIYSHLSGYAHSSHMSVLQVSQALENKDMDMLVEPSIDIMSILNANMIWEYCELFPKAQDVLRGSGASNFVEVWIDIGRRLDENLDTATGRIND